MLDPPTLLGGGVEMDHKISSKFTNFKNALITLYDTTLHTSNAQLPHPVLQKLLSFFKCKLLKTNQLIYCFYLCTST